MSENASLSGQQALHLARSLERVIASNEKLSDRLAKLEIQFARVEAERMLAKEFSTGNTDRRRLIVGLVVNLFSGFVGALIILFINGG